MARTTKAAHQAEMAARARRRELARTIVEAYRSRPRVAADAPLRQGFAPKGIGPGAFRRFASDNPRPPSVEVIGEKAGSVFGCLDEPLVKA